MGLVLTLVLNMHESTYFSKSTMKTCQEFQTELKSRIFEYSCFFIREASNNTTTTKQSTITNHNSRGIGRD